MRIVLFGANGVTGRLLTRRVIDAGHTAIAVTRNPQTFPFSHPALTVAEADVRHTAALIALVDGADAVVSTVGVPFSVRPIDTYSAGTSSIVDAMRSVSVRRLAVVSSSAVYPTPNRRNPPPMLRIVEPILTRTIGKSTYDDQRRMESVVAASGLDTTVIRPSGLFDLPTTTNYVAGEVDPVGMFTARIDLADYLVSVVGDPSTVGKTVFISTVEHTPTPWQMMRREVFKSS